MIYRKMRRAAPLLGSDALVVTRAMQATSIAEIFVERRL